MNLLQIRQEVELLVQDASYTGSLDSYINQAILEVADLVAIPSLKTIDTVGTVPGQRFVSLSSLEGGFSGRLRRAVTGGKEIKVVPDLDSLITAFPEIKETSVEAVVLEGNVLWYHGSPAVSESLILVYYKNPVLLEKDTDIPDFVPQSLHRKLFVHGAAFFIFDQIEDGVEGQKVNAMSHFYHSLYDGFSRGAKSGVMLLREYIAGRRNNCQSSVWEN